MRMCEKGWDLAFAKAREDTSKSQSEHYNIIVKYGDCVEADERVELSVPGHGPDVLPLHQSATRKKVP